MKSGIVTFAAALLAMGSVPPVLAGNGIETYEMPVDVTTPVIDCLGEAVEGRLWVYGRIHEINTPGGVYHVVDNWFYKRGPSGVLTGVITGRSWTIHGNVSFSMTIKEGEVVNESDFFSFKPLDDGPMWQVQGIYKVTINANGDQKVMNFTFGDDPQSVYKCFKK